MGRSRASGGSDKSSVFAGSEARVRRPVFSPDKRLARDVGDTQRLSQTAFAELWAESAAFDFTALPTSRLGDNFTSRWPKTTDGIQCVRLRTTSGFSFLGVRPAKPYENHSEVTCINQGRGLSPLPHGKKRRPIIRSITHAPDQTNRRPRLIHCPFDLAAPTCCHGKTWPNEHCKEPVNRHDWDCGSRCVKAHHPILALKCQIN